MAEPRLRAKRAWSAAVAGATLALAASPPHAADELRQTPLGALRGQSDGVVDPKGERVLSVRSEPEAMRRLAEAYLRKRGLDPAKPPLGVGGA